MKGFEGHGSLDCYIKDQVLYIQGNGPWNLEALQQANEKYRHVMETLHGRPWGKVLALIGDPIYVPDAADYLVKTIQKDRANGCVATAIVVEQSNSPEFAKRHISELHTRAVDTFRFFVDQDEASWWLVQQISSALLV